MNKNIKKLLSIVSMILCITIVSSIPAQAISETIDKNKKDTVYSSFDDVQGETENIGNIVAELTDERTETSKEFLLDDGTKMIAEYSQPVHYKNSKGKWVEYNNSLKITNSTSTADEASNEEYTNKSSDIDIKLSNKAKANNMIKLSSDDYSISWGYNDANKSKINIVSNNEKLNGNEKFTTLKNITSEAKYENVYKNVDLQYFVTSTGVKENIILKSSDVQNEFNLTYKINDLTAKQTDEYTITLYNKENKAIYNIVAPYMIDAKDKTSTKLKLEIASQKGGKINVKLTADSSFINSPDRSFPVTIDPTVSTELKSSLLYSYTGYIRGNTTSNPPYYLSSYAYSKWKINTLPTIENSQKITKATFNFSISSISGTVSTNDPIVVNLHNYSSSSPYYNSQVEDYCAVSSSSDSLEFDITNLMRNWVDGTTTNNGFVIEAVNSIGTRQLSISTGDKSHSYPTYEIVYKDFSGLEDNLSYHTVSAGSNAQISVNDYLGNLTVTQSLYESKATRMPISLSATYNSLNYDSANDGDPIGIGWHFSFDQYIEETDDTLTNAGYDYIYIDGDGTKHYLVESDDSDTEESWTDEDDLGLTLKQDGDYLYLDDGSKTMKFNLPSNGGNLVYEYENEHKNNHIAYSKSNTGTLNYIYDSVSSTTTFSTITINNQKYISAINLPNSEKVYLSYTQSGNKVLLTKVKLADGTCSNYTYDSNGRLNSVRYSNESGTTVTNGSSVTTTYNSSGQVTNITEKASDDTVGQYINLTYNNDNTTKITDRKGRTEIYTFDNEGNKVSTLNANGFISTGDNSGLTASSGSDSFTKNYITESTEQSKIKNGGYYFKADGGGNGLNSTGGTATIDTSAPTEENGQVQYFGTTSIKINNPVSEDNSAFFTGVAHQINGNAFNGKDVTFSAYVKTKDIKQIYSGGAIGAILKIKCLNSDGATVRELNSIGITGSEDWQRLSISTTVPETTANIRVYCYIRFASGTAWFDCLQFEEGSCANDFNALQNGDFENNEYWLTNENNSITAQNGTVTINGKAGAYVASEDSNENSNENGSEDSNTEPDTETENTEPSTYCETVTETVPNDSITTYDDYGNEIKTEQGFVIRTVKNIYEVTEPTTSGGDSNNNTSGENSNTGNSLGNKYIYQNVNVGRAGVRFNISGEAQAKSIPLSNENRTYGIALKIYYDGSSVPETHYQKFNAYTTHKQTVCMSVTPEKTSTKINYVAFAFVYGNNSNTMTVHNAMLNIASAYAIDSPNDETETEGEDNLIDSEIVSESVDTTQEHMVTSSTYDSTGNYVASETNEAGNTVTYTYDTKGNTTSATDGNGNVTNYTYNSSDNITSIKSGAENQYSYNGLNNISAITHNGFSYTFNYDVFNNLISTKIGNTAIVSNTYSANNGNLTKTTYANGDYIKYTYDEYDNITKLTSETGVIAEFTYNKKGLVAKAVDKSSSTTTYYYYDFDGILTGEYRQISGGDLSYFLGYDSNGNKIEKTSINGQTKIITTGTDKDGKAYVSNDGVTAKTVTDDFGRTTQIKTSRGEDNGVFFTDYEYASGKTANSTTNLVSKITQKYGDNELVNYEYAYDKNENITEIKQDGKLAYKYTYDSLNQLKEEYDYINLFYINYSYDKCGNLIAKHEQALDSTYLYPTGKDHGNVYTYGDDTWKDKLTKVGGYDITYDEIGNPLSYCNGMTMTWENGRQLASLQTADNNVSYKYDSNGMRTQKTDNSGTTYYYYDSDKNLIGLTKDNATLLFYYDSDGSVTSFKYNGTMYYYIKSLQGDIVKIINQSGTEVANYVYDAWGNIHSETGDTTIRNLNPFRYRSYVYDEETSLYYLQSRYYDPFTGRFLNADMLFDTQSGTPLSTNMFAYCENNAINFTDYTGYKSSKSQYTLSIMGSLVKIYSKGFFVNERRMFLSRNFCLIFANAFLNVVPTTGWIFKKYSGMSALRIAQEIWFHAVVYYIGKPLKAGLKKIGIKWEWLNGIVKSAKEIQVNSDDSRWLWFKIVWYGGTIIKYCLPTRLGGVLQL